MNDQNRITFRSRAWRFIKDNCPAFVVGALVGAGATFALMNKSDETDEDEGNEFHDMELSLSEQIG